MMAYNSFDNRFLTFWPTKYIILLLIFIFRHASLYRAPRWAEAKRVGQHPVIAMSRAVFFYFQTLVVLLNAQLLLVSTSWCFWCYYLQLLIVVSILQFNFFFYHNHSLKYYGILILFNRYTLMLTTSQLFNVICLELILLIEILFVCKLFNYCSLER